jgi:hypothetical protein
MDGDELLHHLAVVNVLRVDRPIAANIVRRTLLLWRLLRRSAERQKENACQEGDTPHLGHYGS